MLLTIDVVEILTSLKYLKQNFSVMNHANLCKNMA